MRKVVVFVNNLTTGEAHPLLYHWNVQGGLCHTLDSRVQVHRYV